MRINDIIDENKNLKTEMKQLKENNNYLKSKNRSYKYNINQLGKKIKSLRDEVKELNTIVQKNETAKLSYSKQNMQKYNELLINYNILKTALNMLNDINTYNIYTLNKNNYFKLQQQNNYLNLKCMHHNPININNIITKYTKIINNLEIDNTNYKNELNEKQSIINELIIKYNTLSIEYNNIYKVQVIPKSEYLRILKINNNLENTIQYLKSEMSELDKNIYKLAEYNNVLNGKYNTLHKTSNTTIEHMENMYNILQINYNNLQNNFKNYIEQNINNANKQLNYIN